MTTTTITPAIANTSTPAAFGARWETDGTQFELACPRGTQRLIFGMLPNTSTRWTVVTVDDPTRFTGGDNITTNDDFLAVVARFQSPNN